MFELAYFPRGFHNVEHTVLCGWRFLGGRGDMQRGKHGGSDF